MPDPSKNTQPAPERAPMYKLPCAYHLDEASIGQCALCKKSVCHHCFGHDMSGVLVCQSCRTSIRSQLGPPWETPSENTLHAFVTTLWGAVRSPRKFMQSMPAGRPWLPAAIFGITCMVFGMMVATMWEFLLTDTANDKLMMLIGKKHIPPSALRALAFARPPAMAPVIMIFHVLVLQATLNLAGVPAQRGTIIRIFGFSCSAYLFLLIPPIGGFSIGYMLMLIWLFNLEAHGIQRFYQVSSTKATLVVMVPTFLGVLFQCF